MVIGAHIWGTDIEESLLLYALKKTASLQPDTKFIFFTNATLQNIPQNCVQVFINPRPTNKPILYYWYKYCWWLFSKSDNIILHESSIKINITINRVIIALSLYRAFLCQFL